MVSAWSLGLGPPPRSVDWRLTRHCQLGCDFCYVPDAEGPEPLRHQVLQAMLASGVRIVTFCGGEPLVVGNVGTFATSLRNAGKRTILNTNGLLLRRRVDQGLAWAFDAVGLSIHGSTQGIHEAMQGAGADLEEVIRAAEYVRGRGDGTVLKLATVVSEINRTDIPALAERIREEIKPTIWRLYQYSSQGPQNRGPRDRERRSHRLSEEEFLAIAADAEELAQPVATAPATEEDNQGCLIVDPDGAVLLPNGRDYDRYGSCLDEPLDEIWARMPHTAVEENKSWHAALGW